MEVTKWLKPSGKRATIWWQCGCAGRNASERRASLENTDAQADPHDPFGEGRRRRNLESDRFAPAVPPG